jgi:hypothetical protein
VDSVWQQRAKFQDRGWLHVLLFMLTLVSTTLVGASQYAAFLSDFAVTANLPLPLPALVLRGFWYSATILAILGAHEMGHYLACRYYDVDASLPFFIPMPVLQTGTMGAFIRIREPIPQKRMLFDIGIAGPIAGFLVAVPALFLGLALSRVVAMPTDTPGMMELGEPLLFKFASWLIWGHQADGFTINMHPMAFAAWFGLLATANAFGNGGGPVVGSLLAAAFGVPIMFTSMVAVLGGAGWVLTRLRVPGGPRAGPPS